MVYQMGTALTDAVILSIIERGDAYGYAIVQQMKRVVDIKDSALYPVLRRLTQNGFVVTYDQPYQGRNRKYYHITEHGKAQLAWLRKEWIVYRTEIEDMLMNQKT